MPHQMRIQRPLHADPLAELGDHLLNAAVGKRLVWRPARCKERLAAPALRDVELQHELRADGKINRSLLVALADDLALAVAPVDIVDAQTGDFGHAAARGYEELDERLLLVAPAAVAHKLELLGRQRVP